MAQNNTPIAEEFLDLRQRLAEWRTNHPRRTPLPEEFWTEAAELARKHGLYRTSRSLPIDYASLRKRLEGASVQKTPRPQFLELLSAAAGSSYCVDVLRVRGDGALDWNQLLRAWGQSGR
jgi:hypothetical protein